MKEKNINVSLKSIWWMDKDEDGAGRPFLRAGFTNTEEIMELRIFDMLNIMGIDRIIAEEMMYALYRAFNEDKQADDALYEGLFTCWSAMNRERSCFSENVNVNKLIHDFSIFYLPHPGLFLFLSKKNKKISKTRGQLSKKFSNWVVEGHDPGHLENRISIHQIPSLYQEPKMQARGDFFLLRNERSGPICGQGTVHQYRITASAGAVLQG